MISLLDANVLLALCWEELEGHESARVWFHAHAHHGWATCTLTESAFLRLSMNPKLFPDPATFGEALGVLTALRSSAHHHFLLPAGPLDASYPVRQIRGYKQVTDATLLALAHETQAKLISFDQGLTSLARAPGWQDRLQILNT
jgi:uncharacterized protein